MPAAIEWTPELIDAIENEIISGRSIASICGSKVFPHHETTFWRKFQKDQQFASVIARAMETRTEREMEALIDLADTADAENANAVKLRVWTRMWVAAKLKPKKYGDRTQLVGADDGPVELKVTHIGADKRDT